jgi:pimeloyl-ACP methyl ester carboxylesterase
VWRGGWNTPAMRMQLAALRATGPETWTGAGSAPVLIIQAADDLIAPRANAEILARTYPDRVRVALLAHAGHAMLPEQPAEIARLVIAELKTAR